MTIHILAPESKPDTYRLAAMSDTTRHLADNPGARTFPTEEAARAHLAQLYPAAHGLTRLWEHGHKHDYHDGKLYRYSLIKGLPFYFMSIHYNDHPDYPTLATLCQKHKTFGRPGILIPEEDRFPRHGLKNHGLVERTKTELHSGIRFIRIAYDPKVISKRTALLEEKKKAAIESGECPADYSGSDICKLCVYLHETINYALPSPLQMNINAMPSFHTQSSGWGRSSYTEDDIRSACIHYIRTMFAVMDFLGAKVPPIYSQEYHDLLTNLKPYFKGFDSSYHGSVGTRLARELRAIRGRRTRAAAKKAAKENRNVEQEAAR